MIVEWRYYLMNGGGMGVLCCVSYSYYSENLNEAASKRKGDCAGTKDEWRITDVTNRNHATPPCIYIDIKNNPDKIESKGASEVISHL